MNFKLKDHKEAILQKGMRPLFRTWGEQGPRRPEPKEKKWKNHIEKCQMYLNSMQKDFNETVSEKGCRLYSGLGVRTAKS